MMSQVQSGRSERVIVDGRAKVDGLEPKWAVQDDSGRSFEPKWTVQDESGRSFEPKWTVMGQSRRSFD